MPSNYDLSTEVGKVRLLLNDVNASDPVYTDDEINAFLDMEGSVKLAAAQAIDTGATNQALASKVLRTQDLSTDGAKVADAMRAHAARLREQAADEEAETEDGFYFGIVDVTGPRTGAELTGGR